MIDILALKAEMVRNGYTQEKLAEKLEISSKTLSSRFKKGVFSSDEIESQPVHPFSAYKLMAHNVD